MVLVVGLGNPGDENVGTPHNVGFEVVSRIVSREGLSFRRARYAKAEEAKSPGGRLVLMRPMTFMNLSGNAVTAGLNWHRLVPADLLVVCDDVNLPLGHLRFRIAGGSGGQKGLESVVEAVGTEAFFRLRIGVGGGAAGADVASHVLRQLRGTDKAVIDEAIERAADAVQCFLGEGAEAAMNRYNTPRLSEKDTKPPSGGQGTPDNQSPKG